MVESASSKREQGNLIEALRNRASADGTVLDLDNDSEFVRRSSLLRPTGDPRDGQRGIFGGSVGGVREKHRRA